MKRFLTILGLALFLPLPALANSEQREPKQIPWPYEGVGGTFDKQAIQRGFQVYKEVCASCHSLKHVAYRNLMSVGFSEDEVKAIAAEKTVIDGFDKTGEPQDRPAKPSDHIVGPFKNEQEARSSNNGALPPDLSLIIKAREGGGDYVYSILTGFTEVPPEEVHIGENMHYNPYFPGRQIAMPPPLASDGQVEYADGTPATVDQMARDVVQFLQWAAEPEMEERKSMGISALVFLGAFTFLFFAAKKRIWKGVEK